MLILKLAVEILILWVCYILYMAILVHRRGACRDLPDFLNEKNDHRRMVAFLCERPRKKAPSHRKNA